ncbi:MAG: amino acid ABC transporter permease [Hyphomicrobiaceae bacterium]|uniref:amino acid ABC transporter permease n=1 Tax=Pseudorhodoplanes sp. TaxID=1934341 RepID=UPI003D0A5D75
MLESVRFAQDIYPQFVDALGVTLSLAAVSLPTAFVLGVVLAFARLHGLRAVRVVLAAFVDFLRNTPLLLQMFVLYFGLPLLGWRLSGFSCATIAIAVQHGAYLSEIIRGGVESVSRNQWEAARAIGMSDALALRDVIVPQALVRVTAPIGNQFIVLVKDTSVASAIGVLELTLNGKVIIERTAASFEVFLVIASLYLAMSALLGGAVRLAERRVQGRM